MDSLQRAWLLVSDPVVSMRVDALGAHPPYMPTVGIQFPGALKYALAVIKRYDEVHAAISVPCYDE